jgi:DNA repair protein SbcC/Rad50
LIPVELDLVNFLAYRHPGPLRLEGIHIACLAGPNGAGKSSLLDAITWALWGKARSNLPDELIHQGQTDMRVALTFDQGSSRYRVIRQRRAGKRGASLLELQAWDASTEDWHSLSEAGLRETQQTIDKLLRLDYDTFVNSAFLVQGRADEFTTKTPAERKQVLGKILGLERWELFEQRARDRLGETRAAIQRLEGRLQEVEAELEREPAYRAALESSEAEAGLAAERLGQAERQWADLEQTRTELVTVQRQIDDLTRRIVASEREAGEAQRELEGARAQADRAGLEAQLVDVRMSLEAFPPLEAELAELIAVLAAAREEAAQLRGQNQVMVADSDPLKARLTILQESKAPTCPTCGQDLSDDHRHQLVDTLQSDLESRRERYRLQQVRLKELEAQAADLDRSQAALVQRVRERPALEKRLGELETAWQHAEEAAERVTQLEARLARWGQDLANDQAARRELETRADASEGLLRAAALTQADIDRLRLEKRLSDERVGGARQQLHALESFARQREERRAEQARLAEDAGLYEDLRQAFGKRGVPAMVIETVVPELERAANELLGRMSDGRMHVRIETQRESKEGDLREVLDILISDDLGTRPYELYSGGEAFRIDFAVRIALSRLLARRAGAQLRCLFLDEGFGTQDARGREQLVSTINSIQDDFDRILVITHLDELKDAFPVRIEVHKTGEGSVFQLT